MTRKHPSSSASDSALPLDVQQALLADLTAAKLDDAVRQRLSDRLEARVEASIRAQAGLVTKRGADWGWRPLLSGVAVRPLWRGRDGHSVLLKMAPGTRLPVHRHRWPEEGVILAGGLQLETLELEPFDYHFSPAGSRHAGIRSRQGALAYLRGTSLGSAPAALTELIGGLLPFKGGSEQTVFFKHIEWRPCAPGAAKKELRTDGRLSSVLLRLEPGALLPGHDHALPEECLVLRGELFLGDLLLRAGDYQAAEAGSRHGAMTSDTGALVFLRGAREA